MFFERDAEHDDAMLTSRARLEDERLADWLEARVRMTEIVLAVMEETPSLKRDTEPFRWPKQARPKRVPGPVTHRYLEDLEAA